MDGMGGRLITDRRPPISDPPTSALVEGGEDSQDGLSYVLRTKKTAPNFFGAAFEKCNESA